MKHMLGILSFVVLVLFTAIWVWVGVKLLRFDPSAEEPILRFTDAQATVAGFLASTVGAGTASVLGIEIQKAPGANLAIQVGNAAKSTWLLGLGIVIYGAVGFFVLLVWFWNSEQSPEMIAAFSMGVLGWFAGGFAAVFRKATV
jgi:hypothetical protein